MNKEEFMLQVRKDLAKKKIAEKKITTKKKVSKKDLGTDKRFRKYKRDKKKQVKLHEFEYQNAIRLVELLGRSFNDLVSEFVVERLKELGEIPKTLADYEEED